MTANGRRGMVPTPRSQSKGIAVILWIPCWIWLGFYPRYWLALLLAALITYPAWFVQTIVAEPAGASLYLLSAYAADFLIVAWVIVGVRKWLIRRGAERQPRTSK